MSTNYKRRNRVFEDQLSSRHEVLKAATVTVLPDGRVVLSALPKGYSFPSAECAQQFLRRCLWSKPARRQQ